MILKRVLDFKNAPLICKPSKTAPSFCDTCILEEEVYRYGRGSIYWKQRALKNSTLFAAAYSSTGKSWPISEKAKNRVNGAWPGCYRKFKVGWMKNPWKFGLSHFLERELVEPWIVGVNFLRVFVFFFNLGEIKHVFGETSGLSNGELLLHFR